MSVVSVAYDSAAAVPLGIAAARFYFASIYILRRRGCVFSCFLFSRKAAAKKIKIFLKSDLHFRGVSCLYKWGTKYETQNEKECDENVRT